ncbi:MAG: SpoIIE family protein phosphatase [Spirochaetales bacterium]|nr:SpoIIE family protein phosphatase [Spirochaetales bacterium]
MSVKNKLLIIVSLILVIFVSVVFIVFISFIRIIEYKDDERLVFSVFSKWAILNNTTKELLMADSNHSEVFEKWRLSLYNFQAEHDILVSSERIAALGYEVSGIIDQSKGLWGFYRIVVDKVIDILDIKDGREIMSYLDENHLSILSVIERQNKLDITPKMLSQIIKIRENLRFRRSDSAVTSAEDDFNWLWNNSLIPLLESDIQNQIDFILLFAIIATSLLVLAASTANMLIIRSITKPLRQFLDTFIEGAMGKLSVRYPVKRVACSEILKCVDEKCRMYDESDESCFAEMGSFATLFEKQVLCPHIMRKEVKSCRECLVYKTICREEISSMGAWFNILMGNLERSAKIIEDAQRIWRKDMAMTTTVRKTLYPVSLPPNELWDIAHIFKPVSGVSKDLYDFYTVNGKMGGIGIFNVSGHGISASLVAVIAQSIVYKLFQRMIKVELSKVMKSVNETLINETGLSDHFLYGTLLRFQEDRIQYVISKHSNVIFKNDSKDTVEVIAAKDKDLKEYETGILKLESNDFIVMFTDGFIKGRNSGSEEYGIERALASLGNVKGASAKKIIDVLIGDFNSFIDEARLTDDITLIVLKKNTH